jgi:hypothetical protein
VRDGVFLLNGPVFESITRSFIGVFKVGFLIGGSAGKGEIKMEDGAYFGVDQGDLVCKWMETASCIVLASKWSFSGISAWRYGRVIQHSWVLLQLRVLLKFSMTL